MRIIRRRIVYTQRPIRVHIEFEAIRRVILDVGGRLDKAWEFIFPATRGLNVKSDLTLPGALAKLAVSDSRCAYT